MPLSTKVSFSKEEKIALYRTMVLIRRFEERCIELYKQGLMRGSLHLGMGQEALAAGGCGPLRKDDYLTTTYRGHGHCLAKGADVNLVMAELFGKRTGLNKGKGGKMHLTDPGNGILGANGIVAAAIPTAVGAALAAKREQTSQVSVTYFGDGAVNQGVFHEALNLAAVWDLPVVFICENNMYSEMTPIASMVRIKDLADRAGAYGIEGEIVDGNDVEAVYAVVSEAVRKARSGGGPTFVEGRTYRIVGHMVGDTETYRTKAEVEAWRRRDPIKAWEGTLAESGDADDKAFSEVDAEIEGLLDEAVAFAKASPEPTPKELFEDLYV